jgi:hypothetical protein
MGLSMGMGCGDMMPGMDPADMMMAGIALAEALTPQMDPEAYIGTEELPLTPDGLPLDEQPVMEQIPVVPVYEAPAAPVYEAPAAPVYEAAAPAPVYETPSAPSYDPPSPSYESPSIGE